MGVTYIRVGRKVWKMLSLIEGWNSQIFNQLLIHTNTQALGFKLFPWRSSLELYMNRASSLMDIWYMNTASTYMNHTFLRTNTDSHAVFPSFPHPQPMLLSFLFQKFLKQKTSTNPRVPIVSSIYCYFRSKIFPLAAFSTAPTTLG